MADGIWTMGEMLVEIMRPEPGIELYEPGVFRGPFPSGAPAIFIDTVARLGHEAGIIGGVGDDDFGRCLLERLGNDGVDCTCVGIFPGATAVAFVTYFRDGSRKFIFHIDGTPAVRATFDSEKIDRIPGFFHIMGCSLMANDAFRSEIIGAAHYFHHHGARISFDPNIRAELLGGRAVGEVIGPVMDVCSVIFPGEVELRLLTGRDDTGGMIDSMFRDYPGMETIVLKRGGKGCSVYTRTFMADIPAIPVKEVDPTGAGDCFDAGFLCGMLENRPLVDCAKMAAAAGALNVMVFGPMEGDINPERVERLIQSFDDGKNGD